MRIHPPRFVLTFVITGRLYIALVLICGKVIGIDIAPIQPEWLPPNCRFEIFDMGSATWPWPEGSFDFIFLRDPIMAVKDYPRLIEQIYK